MPDSDRIEPPSTLEEIFGQALTLPPHERNGFLASACGDHAALRHEVEGLIAAHDEAEGGALLETCELDALVDGGARTVAEQLADEQGNARHDEEPGTWIDRYRLLEKIGTGGFGTVWMAEQQEPIRRRVALKIVKLGMDTRQVVARFEQERQALALMDHPNIARVFDAGATAEGRPYFVMELVRGIAITDYCDQARLPTTERMSLFITVCQAVQHAHQKGIIHRDLKPSNVLVTLHDGVPVPKVIDFGIAKATRQDPLTELTLFTQFREMIGTPLYMSPEQAEMSGLDVDTRSDIYSLGVLLYELLTSRLPFGADRLREAGLDEIRRIVREEDPQRPSALVSSFAAEVRTKVAEDRRDESRHFLQRLAGELDWVVMKALEKDRTRRYGTATELASDILNYVQGQPIQARPPSRLYRFRKLVRRNKTIFSAAAAVAVALLAGLGLATWSFFKEREALRRALNAEQQAETEAGKSRQIAEFFKGMLDGVGPSVARGRDTTILKEVLDRTAERVETELGNQPEVEAELRSTIGTVYREIGEYDEALAMHERALELLERRLADGHPKLTGSLNQLAQDLEHLGRFEEAIALQRRVLALDRDRTGPQSREVGASLSNLGTVLWRQGYLEEAQENLDEAVAIMRTLGTEQELAAALNSLGPVLDLRGDFEGAETVQREAVTLFREVQGNEHPRLASAMGNLAHALTGQRKHEEAETILRAVLEMDRKLVGEEHSDYAITLNSLSTALMMQGKLEDAEALQRQSLAIKKKTLGDRHPAVARALNNLAHILESQNKLDEAEALQQEAQPMMRDLLGDEHPDLANSLESLAHIHLKQERYAEAEPLQREALAILRKLHGDQHLRVALAWRTLGTILQFHGKLAEAESLHWKAMAVQEKLLGNNHPEVLATIKGLSLLLMLQNKFPEVEELYRGGLRDAQEASQSDPAPWIYFVRGLVLVLVKQEKFAEADQVYDEILSLDHHLEETAATARLVRMRADHRARRQQWEQADEDYVRAIQLQPEIDFHYLARACVLAQLPDLAAYTDHCRAILSSFGETDDPAVANRMAMACLLRSSPAIDQEGVSALVAVQLEGSENRSATYAYQFVKGLSDFRHGRFAEAAKWMERVLAHLEVPSEKTIQSNAVMAMALLKLAPPDPDLSTVQNAWRNATEEPAGMPHQYLGEAWLPWAITACLGREARALVEEQPKILSTGPDQP